MRNWKTTIAGAVIIIAALLNVTADALQDKPMDWAPVVVALATGTGLILAKDFNVSGKAKMLIPLLLIPAFIGCSTVGTTFKETVTDENGVTSSTTYQARSIAGPLGKLDTTSHKWNYRWGGEENEIATGQDSAGIDNSQQAVLVQMLQATIGALIERIPVPVPQSQTPAPEIDIAPIEPYIPIVKGK